MGVREAAESGYRGTSNTLFEEDGLVSRLLRGAKRG